MNRRITFLLSFAALALLPALSAQAVNPHLVVMAVNSGGDLVAPYDFDPPTMTPGAKGFLIGVDTGDTDAFTGLFVNPMMFSGPGLVHKQGIVNEGDPPTLAKFPRIMTRHEASLQSAIDAINYVPEDTYLIDKLSSSMGWEPVLEGTLGGLDSDHFFTVYATPNPIGSVSNGIYPLAYVVTTADTNVTGLIARGMLGFDVLGNPDQHAPYAIATLDFTTETIRVPEPSSVVLAALGVVGILFFSRAPSLTNVL